MIGHLVVNASHGMNGELLVAYLIIGFAVIAVLIGAVWWRIFKTGAHKRRDDVERLSRANDVEPPPMAQSDEAWPAQLRWLIWLVVLTAVVLVVQLVLGYWTKALVLVADAAHGAADCASYFLAALLEYLKHHFGKNSIDAKVARRLDKASACFSILIVLATSLVAAVTAGLQLSHANTNPGEAEEVNLGGAMTIIACLGLAVNATLLIVQRSCISKAESPAQEVHSPRAARRKDTQARTKRWKCIPNISLHQAFHPGCQDSKCAGQGESNLNLYGVILHVGTDVLRTALLLIIGILVQHGVLGGNLSKVDAICSFVILGFVVLGSGWLLASALGLDDDMSEDVSAAGNDVPPPPLGSPSFAKSGRSRLYGATHP
jgi:Co/Zn/Cd efflux system component